MTRSALQSAAIRLTSAVVLPPVIVGTAYFCLFSHRSDYLGHFLAGYAGTLGVATVVSTALVQMRVERFIGWAVLCVTVACIALGGFLENTVYRIAKWDEVDFCNQSLGAVLAGLGSLAAGGYGRGTLAALVMILWAVVLMIGGYHFAFR